jgi:hypothetical protein
MSVHAMKAYVGIKVLLHAFLNPPLDKGVCSMLRPGRFTSCKKKLYSLNRMFCGPRRWYRLYEEPKHFLANAGIRTTERPAPSIVYTSSIRPSTRLL